MSEALIQLIKTSNDINVVTSTFDQLNELYNNSNKNDNESTRIYTVILDVLLNEVHPNWFQVFTDKQRQIFESFFIPYNNKELLLDSFVYMTNYIIQSSSSRNIDQQIFFTTHTLLHRLNYHKLYDSIIFSSVNENSSQQQQNNTATIELVSNSLATLPDRLSNLAYRLNSNNNSKTKSSLTALNRKYTQSLDNFDRIEYINNLFKDLSSYITNLPKVIDVQDLLSIDIVYSNLTEFLSTFISKVIKIGFINQITETFIPNLLGSNSNNKHIIKLISNSFSSIHGNALDKLLESIISYLPKYNRNVYNILINTFTDMCKQNNSTILFILTNKLLVNKSYSKEVHNQFLFLLSKVSDGKVVLYLNNILKYWSDSYFIRHCTTEHHSCLSRSLVYFIKLINSHDINEELKKSFLKGIEVHLKSTIHNVNIEGMIIAELFSKFIQSDTPLKFDHLSESDRSSLDLDFQIPTIDERDEQDSSQVETIIKTTKVKEDEKKTIQMKLEREFSKYDDPDMIVEDIENDDDNYDEDLISGQVKEIQHDSDDDLKPYNLEDDESDLKGVKKKLYLRDCMIEFQSNKHTAESWESALISIASIVWTKPDDLDELSEAITKSLLHLTNEYGIENFEVVRHEALVALAVNSTKIVVKYLTDCFYQNNFSLGQRLEMLSTLTDAAQELSGYREEKSKQLLEQQKEIKQSIAKNNPLVIVKDEDQDKTNIPTQFIGVTRRWGVSTRPKPKITQNSFHQLSPLFFYPFLSKYDKVTQSYSVDLKGYDIYLLCRLIHALGVFVECSGNSTNTRDMAKELYKFIYPLRYHNDISVRRAILFSFSRIFYTLSNEIIKIDYQDEIEELNSWLSDIANDDADKDCRMMAMGTMSKIVDCFKTQF